MGKSLETRIKKLISINNLSAKYVINKLKTDCYRAEQEFYKSGGKWGLNNEASIKVYLFWCLIITYDREFCRFLDSIRKELTDEQWNRLYDLKILGRNVEFFHKVEEMGINRLMSLLSQENRDHLEKLQDMLIKSIGNPIPKRKLSRY